MTVFSTKKKGLFGLVTAVLVLCLLEGIIRLSPLGAILARPSEARRQAIELHRVYQQPAYGPLPPSSGTSSTTAAQPQRIGPLLMGLRPASFLVPKPPQLLRIVLLGDSTVWGIITGIPDPQKTAELSLGAQLHRQLRQQLKGRQPEIINMGFPGAISEVVLARAREASRFQPDLAVLYLGHNEGNVRLIQSTLDPHYGEKGWLTRHLKLAALLAYLLTQKVSDAENNYRQETFTKNLRQIIAWLRKGNSQPLLCLPTGREPHLYGIVRHDVRQVARAEGVTLIDIERPLRIAAQQGRRSYASFFSDMVHPNADGYQVMAQAIARVVLAQLTDP